MVQDVKEVFLMKKTIAILLALIMLFSTAAFAEETGTPSGDAPTEMGAPPEGTPPEGTPPDGFGGGNGGPGGTPPDGTPPDGFGGGNGGPGGTPPDGTPPDGFGGGSGGPGGPGGTPPGGGTASFEYAAASEITEAAELTDETYVSETSDENALIINTDAEVSLVNPLVLKTGDSDGGDNCSFYGLNAGILVMGGSSATITGGTVKTSASGANGVFSYGGNGAGGDGTAVTVSDMTITTTGDGSGGIMTTGGGITYANNLTVETSGRSSAAIRTDRGGGTVLVDGGSYTTSGLGSPAIYSTADITVKNAALISNLSEGVCIEGMNSITLENCDLTACNTACNGKATFLDTIMIYQSMSGDADSGTSSFTMTGGSLTSLSGHMFHVTNTHAVITLSDVELKNEGSGILLSVCDDGWSGASNIAELTADHQGLEGTILVGANSSLTLTVKNGSAFTGTFSGDIANAKGDVVSAETGTVHVSLDSTSTWTLTADTSVTSFEGDAGSVISNGFTLYVNGTALEGTK